MMLIFPTHVMLEGNPTPKPWPPQFHALLYQNSTGKLAIVDLWYDWPGGRNLNLIQHQLGKRIHDVEWTNGTSFYFDLEHQTCLTMTFPVGILHPDWLANATYVGEQEIEGFKCNVWEKLDFITYYEDIDTKRPVSWVFFTGKSLQICLFMFTIDLQSFYILRTVSISFSLFFPSKHSQGRDQELCCYNQYAVDISSRTWTAHYRRSQDCKKTITAKLGAVMSFLDHSVLELYNGVKVV